MVEVATVMPTRRVGGTHRDGHDSIVATLGVLLRLLDDSSRTDVWPDSVQVIGGKLFMRLPTG